MKSIFVAYPYRIERYKEAIAVACDGIATPAYADDVLTKMHILTKIMTQMRESDLALFDLTGRNANVALELGIAIALDVNYRILLGPNDENVISDMQGWDQLRYSDLDDLGRRLRVVLEHPATRSHPRLAGKTRDERVRHTCSSRL